MSAADRLLRAVQTLHEATPALRQFAPWPDDLTPQPRPLAQCPVAEMLTTCALPGTTATEPVKAALRDAAPDLHWKQSYTEDQVGAWFLAAYGYVELFGPTGHFHAPHMRGYLGLWGPNLTYNWHAHQAEELYFSLAGHAAFCTPEGPNTLLRPGASLVYPPEQLHLMATLDQPFLAYALWQGDGFETPARLVNR